MGRYLCEVVKDNNNNELDLVHHKKYDTQITNKGSIQFKDNDELDRYFRNHCISEEAIKKSENNLFTFLFWTLLIIFIITIVTQMCSSKNVDSGALPNTTFGRFTF